MLDDSDRVEILSIIRETLATVGVIIVKYPEVLSRKVKSVDYKAEYVSKALTI